MFSLLAIPIVSQATDVASSSASFFSQPVDVILYDLLLWFGWIPVVVTLGWGMAEMWLDSRRGMFASRLKYIFLAIDVPNMTEQSPKAIENLFSSIYPAKSGFTWKEKWFDGKLQPVFSFEIVSNEGYIRFLIRTQARFRDLIEAGIYAQYPEAEIAEMDDYAKDFPDEFPNETHEMWGVEMTLDKPDIIPIRTYVDFEDKMTQEIKDPIGLTLEQLAKMRAGEHMWIQILVQPSTQDWQKKAVDHVRKIYGDEDKKKKGALEGALESTLSWPAELVGHATGIELGGLFGGDGAKEDDPWKAFKITLPQKEEAEAVLLKASKLGMGVKLRVVYIARKEVFAKVERTAIVKGIFNQYTQSNLNKFSIYGHQVPKDDYFWMRWEYTKKQHTLMSAYKKRSWGVGANPFFLNTEELASLWHFPTVTMKAPLVQKSESKRAEPPTGLPITFMENTLPGFIPSEGSSPHDPIPSPMVFADELDELSSPPGLNLEPISDEPLPEALPHLTSPTGYIPEQEDLTVPSVLPSEVHSDARPDSQSEDLTNVPPNLPT